jgi:hypothetical protein
MGERHGLILSDQGGSRRFDGACRRSGRARSRAPRRGYRQGQVQVDGGAEVREQRIDDHTNARREVLAML